MSSSTDNIDLVALRDHLVTVALHAGEMITSARRPTATSLDTKKNSADLVTETDRAVEEYVSTTLKQLYPDFSFMGEETYVPGQKLGEEPTFVVDPIDGTTNFVHGWPYVSVSLGFAVGKVPTVGVVYNPFSGKLYHGIKGRGSHLRTISANTTSAEEDVKLPLRSPPATLDGLDGCVVAIEYGSDRSGGNWRTKTETWAVLGASKEDGGAMVHSARALGSAALNLCGVAEGTLDAYWEGGCWAWDVCAGWVVLTEAGGVIVDGNPHPRWEDGNAIPVDHRKYLAVRASGGSGTEAGQAQRHLVLEFWSHIKGHMEYEH